MAEGRMLKKAISKSRRLAALQTDSARMLYTWIIPHLDIEGRFFADPSIIKGSVVPRLKAFSEEKITECLSDMASVELITLYTVDNDQYFHLRKFEDHQSLRENREAKSTIPPPSLPDNSRITPGVLPDNSGITPAQVKLREVKLSKEKLSKEAEHLPVDNSKTTEEDSPPFESPPTDTPSETASFETGKKNPFQNTHGERWTAAQGKELDDLGEDIKQRYGPKYYQQVYVWIQTNFNKANPEAVLFCLRRLIQDRLAGKSIPAPGRWLEAVLAGTKDGKGGENAKAEARESELEHEDRKTAEARDVAILVSGIGRTI